MDQNQTAANIAWSQDFSSQRRLRDAIFPARKKINIGLFSTGATPPVFITHLGR